MSSITAKLLSMIENRDFGADEVVDAQSLYPILKEAVGTDLEKVCYNLFHFTSDTDLRINDRYYRKFQEGELDRLIKLLKADDMAKATRITFLK